MDTFAESFLQRFSPSENDLNPPSVVFFNENGNVRRRMLKVTVHGYRKAIGTFSQSGHEGLLVAVICGEGQIFYPAIFFSQISDVFKCAVGGTVIDKEYVNRRVIYRGLPYCFIEGSYIPFFVMAGDYQGTFHP
jgi:hypothetical protein